MTRNPLTQDRPSVTLERIPTPIVLQRWMNGLPFHANPDEVKTLFDDVGLTIVPKRHMAA